MTTGSILPLPIGPYARSSRRPSDATPSARRGGTIDRSSATQRTILLVDDDATQLKLGRLRLSDAGYAVDTALDAEEALAKAERARPDVVMTDVVMGDVDGFTLCRRLKDHPTLSDVPVLLLSAHYRGEADQEMAARVGAAMLVTRTPTFEAELTALRQRLDALAERTPSGMPPSRSARLGGEPPDVAFYEQHLRTAANQVTKLAGQARSAEERFRTLFENANDAISVLTPEGMILEANARWGAIMGIPPSELIGRHIGEYAAPGQATSNSTNFQSSLARGSGHRECAAIQRADGTQIYMEFSNSLIQVDGRPLVFTIGHDVTDRVNAAQTLAKAEERYRTLVERIPEVIWTCTTDLQITFMTPNIERIVGYTVDEMMRHTPDELIGRVHPDERDAVVDGLRGLLDRGMPYDLEYRFRRKDGQWAWLRDRTVGSYERDGVRYFDGMISDVTERRRLEESVRQAQKMEAIGQLTGGIAHDFNNVLAAILANSHFLLEDLAEHDPRRADAEEIKLAAERAAALTRQLLAFSRKQRLEPTVVDLNDAIGGLERMLRRLIGEDVDFSVVRGDHVGTVRVDVGQLEQVVMNLAVNARDAMPKGGKLTITTTVVELDEASVAIHATAPGRYAVIAVTDTGHGMDADVLRRIFEPFFTTKEVGRGTGLGLATCYGIVKQSGGFITVDSEVDRGSTFRVYLPCTDCGSTPSIRPSSDALDGDETILLLEDDDRVRTAVRRILEARGYRIVEARDGMDALAVARGVDNRIDLIVSDVIMRGPSGPEVVADLRRIMPTVKALFISGYTDHPVLRTQSLEVGVDFVQKPFAPETLAMKVRDVLDGGSPRHPEAAPPRPDRNR